MNSRERIRAIIRGEAGDRCGFWLGNPHPDSWPQLHSYFHTSTQEELREVLNDDFYWLDASIAYNHPEGKPVFDFQSKNENLSSGGIFSETDDLGKIEAYRWPNPDFLDFSHIIKRLHETREVYRASGLWSPFFHDVADFLGMENYFLKMLTQPEFVHLVSTRVTDFYIEANRRLFEACGDLIDGFFFGNDLGTQLDLLIRPDMLEEFIFPYFRKLIQTAREYNKDIILHSCGSIYKILPALIEMGIDAIHPIQAKAKNMDAENLAKQFKEKIAFIGGIDTQEVLIHQSPSQIKEEVKRVIKLLGPRFIISPSHEAILPDIPPQNIEAMASASRKI